MSLGNPYLFDRPVEDPKAFVGRQDALAWVEEQLRDKRPEQTLWILGPPRFGKTSLLRQLRARLAGRYILVEISAPSLLAPRLGPSLARLAEVINQKLAEAETNPLEVPLPFDLQGDPTEFGQLYLPLLLQALHSPLLLALDDFCRPGSEAQQASARWVELGRYLADLAAREPRLQLLFAAERTPADWPEPRRRLLWRLGPLTQEEARRLLRELAAGELKYDYEAEERLLRVAAGQPYFLQLFAHTLFERCREQGRVRLRDVEEALLAAAPHAQPYLDDLRETSSPEAQAVWSCLRELRWGHGVILEQEVHLLLQRKGPPLSARAVSAGLQELAERGVLEALSSGAYRTQVEPVHTWLASQGRPEGARRARVLPAGRGRPWSLFWPLTAGTIVVGLALWSLASGGGGSPPEVAPSPTRSEAVIGAALPTIPPRPRPALVYMLLEEVSQTWEIYSMASDGSHPLRLTQNEFNDSWPTWSWDGRYVAFVSERDGNREIYRMRPDGEQVINLTRHSAPDTTPSFSPDGTRIVFASRRDGNWELYIMNSDGSQPARITFDPAPDLSPAWSPDGTQIAFISERDGNKEIYLLAANGSQLIRLTDNPATDDSPAWSPDGALIAFESYRDGNMEIYVINADGSDPRNVTKDPYSDDHGPSWTPDGTRLAFYSNRDGIWDLYLIDLEGEERVNLTASPQIEQGPAWRP